MVKNKQAQTTGLITGLIFGIASLVIGVIIAFVIVSTLSDADLLSGNRDSVTVSNESGWVNATTYTLTNTTEDHVVPSSFSILGMATLEGLVINSANYTITNGVLVNSTFMEFTNASINYTYSLYNSEELSADDLSANFTKGVDNVSSKIPTILLIAAIVLILGVLVLLVGAWQKMRIGGGSI